LSVDGSVSSFRLNRVEDLNLLGLKTTASVSLVPLLVPHVDGPILLVLSSVRGSESSKLLLEVFEVLLRVLELLLLRSPGLDEISIKISLLGDDIVLLLLSPDLVGDDELLEASLLDVLLSELGLHVGEKGGRHDAHVSDLDSADVDTPALGLLSDLGHDDFAETISVLEDGLDGRVGDPVANDGTSESAEDIVSGTESVEEVQVVESPEWALSFTVDAPLEHGADLDSLVLFGDLQSLDLDLDESGWELCDAVKRRDHAGKTDTGIHDLSIAGDDEPLVRLG